MTILSVAFAGRPLTIDDADPADVDQAEIDAGVGYAHDSGLNSWEIPIGWSIGVVPNVEIGIGFGGHYENGQEGVADTSIGAKWQYLSSGPLRTRHAIAPSVKLPTADKDKGFGSGKTDTDLTYILSSSLGDSVGLHFNVGYSWNGGPEKNILLYGVALDFFLTDSLQWVGELTFDDEMSGDADTVIQYNTGFRWSINDTITFDIAGGSRIDGEAPDFFATIGLTWAYGLKTY